MKRGAAKCEMGNEVPTTQYGTHRPLVVYLRKVTRFIVILAMKAVTLAFGSGTRSQVYWTREILNLAYMNFNDISHNSFEAFLLFKQLSEKFMRFHIFLCSTQYLCFE